MTKEESKRRIIEQWNKWKPDPNNATYEEKSAFYEWLKGKHPELLKWRLQPLMTDMDRWQDVQGWLNQRTNYGRK
jgi:hypothetical protein